MRKILLALVAVASFEQAGAQCIPNPAYQDSVFGVWPDSLEGFAHGIVNIFYSDTLYMKVPSDAGEIDPLYAGVVLDSVRFDGVDGLPPGLAVDCNSQTPAPCTYLTGILGCGLIDGIPTAIGDFPLTFNVTAYTFVLNNVVPFPYAFQGYHIVIDPDTAIGISEIGRTDLGSVRNVPNPFADRTTIEFQLAQAGKVHFKAFNLIGEQLREQEMNGRSGLNRLQFNADGLEDGIYLYKLETDRSSYTGRMVLHR
ncbi:MAG: T9SS type A sorting domain-containing protein [Flavobacteriales bacterium]|nr:T9SS type A sorting domain-containing protein [Flavobacteriales bacterium]